MIFSSLQYLVFLPIVVFLYWRMQGVARLTFVVLASYFFYMSWLPVYGLLLFTLTTLNWFLGIAIDQARNQSGKLAKGILIGGIVINLGSLCYYKYTGFILANTLVVCKLLAGMLPAFDAHNLHSPALNIILPLGISFFVFEFIHYLVDVYRGSKPLTSWMEFAAFAAFFPSQIAGPIKRYQEFIGNLRSPLPWSSVLFYEGMTLIVQGMFKKLAIADPLGWVIAPSYATLAPLSSSDALIAVLAFPIQIFCDFSGYTDIGRGSALLLGIKLPINFALPYLAQDIAAYWRNWHISLSSWVRDYLYIPMGCSHSSHFGVLRNLFITMAICGLWHGASWNFVVWGCIHGMALIVNKEWNEVISSVKTLQTMLNTWPVRIVNILITFCFVALAFIVFRAPDQHSILNVLQGLTNTGLSGNSLEMVERSGVLIFSLVYLGFWIFTDLLKKVRGIKIPSILIYSRPVRMAAWTSAVLLIIAAKPTQVTPFIYFQF